MEQATISKVNTYTIDPNHSTIRFWVRHMMVAKVHGELSKIEGSVAYADGQLEESAVNVTIDANSLTTGNEQRDGHLKSPDFLDVAQFPTIAYKSRIIKSTGANEYEVVGDLTIHGVTKEVILAVEATPEVKGHFGGLVIGISATAVVNREDFGMQWNQALEAGGVLVGKEIHLQIDAELNRPE